MPVIYRGERFADYNRPKKTRNHPTKSHAVLVKKGDTIRLVRFGAQGAKTYPPTEGESAKSKAMRKAWYARHGKTLANVTVFDPIHWAAKVKW